MKKVCINLASHSCDSDNNRHCILIDESDTDAFNVPLHMNNGAHQRNMDGSRSPRNGIGNDQEPAGNTDYNTNAQVYHTDVSDWTGFRIVAGSSPFADYYVPPELSPIPRTPPRQEEIGSIVQNTRTHHLLIILTNISSPPMRSALVSEMLDTLLISQNWKILRTQVQRFHQETLIIS